MRHLTALLLASMAPMSWASDISVVHGKAAHTAEQRATELQAPAMPEASIQRIYLRPTTKSSTTVPGSEEKRLRVGEPRDVALESESSPANAPAWTTMASGAHTIRLSLVSPGAASLRLGLRVHGLPERAELRFVSPLRPERVLGPVMGREIGAAIRAVGRYWTPITEGEEQQVEVWLPAGLPVNDVRVDVAAASHIVVATSQLMKSTGAGA